MDAVKLQALRELDRDILAFVRGMQKHAPVTEESIYEFIVGPRRRRVTIDDIRDRIIYLLNAKHLEARGNWKDGAELVEYTITADGMDLLDGNIPPRNWKPRF